MICELVNQLEETGISINLRVDQVKLTIPSTLGNEMLLKLKELKARKNELIAYLKGKENDVLAKNSGL